MGSRAFFDAARALALIALNPRPGRKHQPLLGAADRDVHPPFVVAVVDGAEGGDRIDHEERRMAGPVDGLADLGDRGSSRRSRSRCGRPCTDLIACSRSSASFASTTAGSTPWRQSPGTKSTSSPRRIAMFFQRVAKCPVSNIRTLSPGERVLTRLASHAPVPDEAKIMTGPAVLKTRFEAFEHLSRPAP